MPVSQDDSSASKMGDFIPNTTTPETDQQLLDESLKKDIEACFKMLTPRETAPLILSFGLRGDPPKSTTERGEMVDLSSERVRQVRERALKRLKRTSRWQALRNYL